MHVAPQIVVVPIGSREGQCFLYWLVAKVHIDNPLNCPNLSWFVLNCFESGQTGWTGWMDGWILLRRFVLLEHLAVLIKNDQGQHYGLATLPLAAVERHHRPQADTRLVIQESFWSDNVLSPNVFPSWTPLTPNLSSKVGKQCLIRDERKPMAGPTSNKSKVWPIADTRLVI